MAPNTSAAYLQIAPAELEGNVKSLNYLPDEILGHILSFMETRDAVRTRALSKRWKDLRLLSPSLVFNDCRFWSICKDPESNLLKYVEGYVTREIQLRGFVKSFSFEAGHYTIVAALLRSWIKELVMRNVQEVSFDLHSSDEHIVQLPDTLFNCKSLVHFKFQIGCVVFLQLPSTMCLTNLKTLSLKHVQFLDEHSTNQFFSSCPVLEDLTLNHCRWSNMEHVNICAPKLLTLTISERLYYGHANPHGCRITVSGPNLTDFVYEGDFFNEHYLQNAKSIQKACITQVSMKHCDRLYRLLSCLSNAKYLELHGLDVHEVSKCVEGLPMFKNLTRLEIHGSDDGNSVLNNSNTGLMKLLENSPRLGVVA